MWERLEQFGDGEMDGVSAMDSWSAFSIGAGIDMFLARNYSESLR